ncbi:MAG: hypothetical protein LBO09_09120 [Candidatus Peribacteria bacterium]|jgi:hypothetical protein|nr:hypothetical protein [Candidatus Peribacteria bacterium]
MKLLNDEIPETRHITFIRHLESKYNEYKELIKKNPDYIQFMKPEIDPQEKERLAQVLLKDFFEKVGIDYETDISDQGKLQGEKL